MCLVEMKESHSPRFDVIWVQASSFVSSCTWCGVFALTLVFSSETSCRIDGDSEVHPEGGTRTTTTVSSLNQGGMQDVSRSSGSFSSANTSAFRAQSGSDPCAKQDPQCSGGIGRCFRCGGIPRSKEELSAPKKRPSRSQSRACD